MTLADYLVTRHAWTPQAARAASVLVERWNEIEPALSLLATRNSASAAGDAVRADSHNWMFHRGSSDTWQTMTTRLATMLDGVVEGYQQSLEEDKHGPL